MLIIYIYITSIFSKIIQTSFSNLFVANGFTNFMIVDDKGRHFNVNNSVWYWKWDAIEDWTTIQVVKEKEKEEGENLVIRYLLVTMATEYQY
jgi:hypothetical protein